MFQGPSSPKFRVVKHKMFFQNPGIFTQAVFEVPGCSSFGKLRERPLPFSRKVDFSSAVRHLPRSLICLLLPTPDTIDVHFVDAHGLARRCSQ